MSPIGRRLARGGGGALTLALLALGLGSACIPDGEQGGYALFRHLELADEVVIGAPPGWARETAERMVARLETELARRRETELGVRVVVRDPAQARGGERRVRLLIGDLDLPELQPALEQLGVVRGDGPTIRIGALGPFGDLDGGALVATLPDPQHRDAPLTIFVALEAPDPVGWARSDLDLARVLRPTWKTGWQVWEGTGLLVAQGGLDADGRALTGDGPAPPEPPELDGFARRVAADPDLAFLQADLDASRERVLALLGTSPRLEDFEPLLRVHGHPEDLARLARRWVAYRTAPASGVVDLVVAPGLPVDARAAFAELLARRGADEPAEAWLVEGLARHVAQSWWGRDLGEWCAHLERAGLVPGIEELVAPAPSSSPHQVAPLRGLLVEVLVATRGVEALRELWREGGLEIDQTLRRAFVDRLGELAGEHGSALEARRVARRQWVLSRSFRSGIDFVPDPERDDPVVAGPGSRAGAESLAQVAALGANAVSLDVVAFLRGPWADFALTPCPEPAAQMSDLELLAAGASARALGLDVMLEPNLWLAPASTYAGQALVSTTGELRLFFEEYGRFLDHYALLAELMGAEILCLGTELSKVSATRVTPGLDADQASRAEWLLTRWRRLAGRSRAAFSGALTYAAHWAGELERIGFWDELDYCGVDLFVPLAPQDGRETEQRPAFADLGKQLRFALVASARQAAAQGKPLLVTEIGFPSTRDAWGYPERPRGPPDEAAQALFFAALACIDLSGAHGVDGLAGMYVHCWSSDPDAGGPGDRGYTLQGKRGERALERALREP